MPHPLALAVASEKARGLLLAAKGQAGPETASVCLSEIVWARAENPRSVTGWR